MHANTFILFFFNDTATTEIYTLSLHDALPISRARGACGSRRRRARRCTRRSRCRVPDRARASAKDLIFGFAPLECAKYSESRTCDRAAAGAVPLACAAPARAGRRTALRSGARARAAAVFARASSGLDRVRGGAGRGAGAARPGQRTGGGGGGPHGAACGPPPPPPPGASARPPPPRPVAL